MDTIKTQINNLKDYAELAQASYFNFEFINNRNVFELDSNNEKIPDISYPRNYKEAKVTLHHSISQKYCNQGVLVNLEKGDDIFTKMRNDANESFNFDKLNGEFGEIQAQNFAKRYKIKFHQPNTFSGFSATLFYDKEKDRFVVGFRGTESNIKNPLETLKDLVTDIGLTFGKGDFQVNALKQFLLDIAPILNEVDSNKIIFVGHSLGGYLAVIAMQFCDTIDRSLNTQFNTIKFRASQIYTFNSPAIDGIDNMLMRALAALLDKNIMEQVLNPQKVYCVYDSGGINIIASAQYGSRNRLPIYTGKDSHSIIPLTQTLYLYSYFLELDANNTMLESKLQSNNDKEKLSECLYTLNVFMGDIKTAMSILVYEIDKKNKEKYEKFKKQIKWYQSTPNYDGIDYLALFISQVNELAFKIEALKEDNNKYFTSSIDIHTIIDTILKLQEHNYLIEIIDNDKLRAMRNQCKADNKASITEKLSLETCQPFRLVDKNNISYLNENNLHQIFGYKDLGHILSQEWHEEYINGRYKIAKGLYFGGNTISSWSKYVRDKELQIS